MSTLVELELAKLELCPLGHPSHTRALNDLAASLLTCYNQQGHLLDLKRTIEVSQSSLDLCPLGHPQYAHALGWVATS